MVAAGLVFRISAWWALCAAGHASLAKRIAIVAAHWRAFGYAANRELRPKYRAESTNALLVNLPPF
jgi:hypothetical protein